MRHKDVLASPQRSDMRSLSVAVTLLSFAVIAGGCAAYRGPVAANDGVVFKVRLPQAKQVNITGSFNGWDRSKDRLSGPDEDGWWSITLPLGPGRHEYLFLIDGSTWLVDPHGTATADDGFGGKNSVLYLQ